MVLWVEHVSCVSNILPSKSAKHAVIATNGTCEAMGFVTVDDMGDHQLNLQPGTNLLIIGLATLIIMRTFNMYAQSGSVSLWPLIAQSKQNMGTLADMLLELKVLDQDEFERRLCLTFLELEPTCIRDGLDAAIALGSQKGLLINLTEVADLPKVTKDEFESKVNDLKKELLMTREGWRTWIRYRLSYNLILITAAKYFTTPRDAKFIKGFFIGACVCVTIGVLVNAYYAYTLLHPLINKLSDPSPPFPPYPPPLPSPPPLPPYPPPWSYEPSLSPTQAPTYPTQAPTF